MVAELLPCPFCGAHSVEVGNNKGWRIYHKQGCFIPTTRIPYSGIAAWNRRPQPEEAKVAPPTDCVVLTDWIDVEVRIPEPEVFVLCWNGGRTFVEWFGSKHPRDFGVTHWQPYKMPPGATSDMHDGRRALASQRGG